MAIKKYKMDLKNKDKDIRIKVVEELAFTQDSSIIKDLEEILLFDQESTVRRRAALALGRIESLESCEALYKAILNEKDDETRRNAAIALGKMGDERAILPLWEYYSVPKDKNFFENIDRARINLVLTELSQKKGFSSIEELIEWKKKQK